MKQLAFATPEHKRVFDETCTYLSRQPEVRALCLYGAAARGEGSRDSDLDFSVFLSDGADVSAFAGQFDDFRRKIMKGNKGVGKYFGVDLGFAKAVVDVPQRHWTSGPDSYELDIGNTYVYSALVFERDQYFTEASKRYLPYYDESLRQERLAEVLKFCINNLDHIPLYNARELYFQSFSRMYDASREFLQALFISRKVYPIAYDKWIKKQLVEILDLPDVYKQLVSVYEVSDLEGDDLITNSEKLRKLVEEYVR